MKFYTVENEKTRKVGFSPKGSEELYDLDETFMKCADMNELIDSCTEEILEQLSQACTHLKPLRREEWKFLAPITEPKQDIVCLGINYRDHAAEAKKFSDKDFGGKREKTIYFSKRAAMISGPEAEIPSYPGLVEGLDYEVELGVILGKDAKDIKAEEAGDVIFGYTVFDDVSARNLQTQHKQWYFGKSLDGHSVMGPCIVTKDEIEDIYDLGIRCYVNDELRQNGNTGLMIQNIEETIEELSRGVTLKAGTILATGTPSGVGMGFVPPKFLKPGDVVRCEIDQIGTLINKVK